MEEQKSEAKELLQDVLRAVLDGTNAFAEKVNAVASEVAGGVAEVIAERAEATLKTNKVDVETTDKILNGAMNHSRFDIKVSLAEGLLNGLFCGSLITVNIHNYAASQPPTKPEAAKSEEP
jgi:hypothetical protein